LDPAIFAFQAVPPAPGQAGGDHAPAQAEERAPPSGGGSPAPPGGGAFSMLFPLLLVGMLVFLFWSSRSQQKKQDTAISALKKGDRVVTQSGLIGRLVEIEPKYAKLEIAPGVKVQVLRSSLTGRDADDTTPKKDDTAKKSESSEQKT
jgi:preprotein translocase subunit YajC